jgi:glycosyltransferase involved in cell wall biosynthesis
MGDYLNAFLARNAAVEGKYGFPVISSCNEIPKDIIPFSKAKEKGNINNFLCFYENDSKFERVWNNPRLYLTMFRRFRGIIGFDFSLNRDMPLADQITNTMRNRKLCYWYQKNGVRVIPNLRYAAEDTYPFCCDGLPQKSVIALGTHGNVKNKKNLGYLIKGLPKAIKRLQPSRVIIYGAAPMDITYLLDSLHTPYTVYESERRRFFSNRQPAAVQGPLLPWGETFIKESA